VVQGLVPARDRVRLLLEFLGQQLTVDLPLTQVLIDTPDPKRQVWQR
jgi:hypothetical protein